MKAAIDLEPGGNQGITFRGVPSRPRGVSRAVRQWTPRQRSRSAEAAGHRCPAQRAVGASREGPQGSTNAVARETVGAVASLLASPAAGDWLFPVGDRTGPIAPQAISMACRGAAPAAGLRRPVHPHLLRQAFATHSLESGVNLRTIQILLGHANLETTARYLQVADVAVRSTSSPLDSLDLDFQPIEP